MKQEKRSYCSLTTPIPRIIRYVEPGVLPEGLLATLNEAHNLLLIDRVLFEQLSESEQHRVQKTEGPHVEVEF